MADTHRKEIEMQGCIEVPFELTMDEFWEEFISFIEEKNFYRRKKLELWRRL